MCDYIEVKHNYQSVILIVGDVILYQEIDGRSLLFRIEKLRIRLEARTFSCMEFGQDIHQEINIVCFFDKDL